METSGVSQRGAELVIFQEKAQKAEPVSEQRDFCLPVHATVAKGPPDEPPLLLDHLRTEALHARSMNIKAWRAM